MVVGLSLTVFKILSGVSSVYCTLHYYCYHFMFTIIEEWSVIFFNCFFLLFVFVLFYLMYYYYLLLQFARIMLVIPSVTISNSEVIVRSQITMIHWGMSALLAVHNVALLVSILYCVQLYFLVMFHVRRHIVIACWWWRSQSVNPCIPPKPLRKFKVTICNHQAYCSFYLQPDVWFGNLRTQMRVIIHNTEGPLLRWGIIIIK